MLSDLVDAVMAFLISNFRDVIGIREIDFVSKIERPVAHFWVISGVTTNDILEDFQIL